MLMEHVGTDLRLRLRTFTPKTKYWIGKKWIMRQGLNKQIKSLVNIADREESVCVRGQNIN